MCVSTSSRWRRALRDVLYFACGSSFSWHGEEDRGVIVVSFVQVSPDLSTRTWTSRPKGPYRPFRGDCVVRFSASKHCKTESHLPRSMVNKDWSALRLCAPTNRAEAAHDSSKKSVCLKDLCGLRRLLLQEKVCVHEMWSLDLDVAGRTRPIRACQV